MCSPGNGAGGEAPSREEEEEEDDDAEIDEDEVDADAMEETVPRNVAAEEESRKRELRRPETP